MKIPFTILLLFSCLGLMSQKLSSHKIERIIATKLNKIDIGYLWLSPDTDFAQVGFIGKNYQRFRIHFTSVIKSKTPNIYIVKGETKVKDNICDFEGELNIDSVIENKHNDFFDLDTLRQFFISGSYLFKEKSNQSPSGILKGIFSMNAYMDKNYNIHYDDLMDGADSYSNNHFDGTWTSYDGKTTEICNWGDGRVDNCGDLDWGVGDFIVNEKYFKNGWEGSNWRNTIEDMEEYIKDKKLSQWWKANTSQ